MLRMKLAIGRRKRFGRKCGGIGVHRWDVSKLQGSNEDKQGRELARGRYLRCIGERIREQWDESSDTETKWSVLKAALCEEAKELGVEDRRQPDRFREGGAEIKPIIAEKNRLHTLWLSTGLQRDRKKYVDARRLARKTVRAAKDAWFLHKAMEAERGRHRGKLVWSCIRDIQRGRRGLVPMRLAAVKNEDGSVCATIGGGGTSLRCSTSTVSLVRKNCAE